MLKKTCVFIAFTLVSVFSTYSQDIRFKNDITQELLSELLERMNSFFGIKSNFTFEYTIYDLAKFEDLEDSQELTEGYEALLLEAIKEDSNSLYAWNELGNHYRDKEELELSQKAYFEAYSRLNESDFSDRAQYYSFRGILKINLNIDGGLDDIENALSINENDSISVAFYPMFLLENGDFEKAKKIVLNQLKDENNLMYLSYVLLSFIKIYEHEFSQKEHISYERYYKTFNFNELDDIAKRFKGNFYIQVLNDYVHMYALMRGFLYNYDPKENSKKTLNYRERRLSKRYIKKFNKIRENNKINPSTTSYVLGMLYLTLENFEKSKQIANSGLNTIPKEKLTRAFNDYRLKDFLISVHALREEFEVIPKLIHEYYKNQSLSDYSAEDLYTLATIKFNENDLDSAKYYCDIIIDAKGISFEPLQLIIHIAFLEKNYNYLDDLVPVALDYLNDYTQFEQLFSLLAMYSIYIDDSKQAYNIIQQMKKELSDNDLSCDNCDYLLDTFFIIE